MSSRVSQKCYKSLEDELFYIGLLFLAFGAAVAIFVYGFLGRLLPEIPCPFDYLLGIYCPGCGGTRAVTALAHGHLLQAVWYHPLVPYGFFTGGGFMLTQSLHRLGLKWIKGWKYHSWYLYGAAIITVGNFLIKNMLRLIWGITM